jgi:hypothetical protein
MPELKEKQPILVILNTLWNLLFNPVATLLTFGKLSHRTNKLELPDSFKTFNNGLMIGSTVGAIIGLAAFLSLIFLKLIGASMITGLIGYAMILGGSILFKFIGAMAGKQALRSEPDMKETEKGLSSSLGLALFGNAAKHDVPYLWNLLVSPLATTSSGAEYNQLVTQNEGEVQERNLTKENADQTLSNSISASMAKPDHSLPLPGAQISSPTANSISTHAPNRPTSSLSTASNAMSQMWKRTGAPGSTNAASPATTAVAKHLAPPLQTT